ncbi:ABC transporter permease [Mechercharimyces sp. CAU 1602]|uniref:ABC transporter permease n=1 Tax=Mechercharimyces sp. CAU 1602 TaxID=2973933 RepID=UPI0021634CE9|nr:ABC transporter permease [Mechercharimyces sp. CAU 1602]MCS1351465.1 ABC transporter permease [Mechercharimyces sp. CAU 1602]
MRKWLARGAKSQEHGEYLRKERLKNITVHFMQLLLLLTLIGGWEWGARTRTIDPFLFSSPSRIYSLFLEMSASGDLFYHMGVTSLETITGFILGTCGGIFLATLIWWSPFLARVLDPYLVIANSMPKVALGPLFIVTMGAGFLSIVAMAVAITIIITTLVIYTRFQSTPQQPIQLAKSLGASRLTIFRLIIFPHAVPDMISTLKVNVGLAWVGVIVGEFLVSESGLGHLMIYGFQVFHLSLVMLSLILVAILATIMYQAIAWLENRLQHHQSK